MKKTFLNIPPEKRQLITDTALKEFAEKGYEMTSTNQLVKTLNISKGSLFKYFESKRDLFVYLVDYSLEKLELFLSDLNLDSRELRENILIFASREYLFLCQNPEILTFFHRLLQDINHPDLKDVRNRILVRSGSYQNQLVERLMPQNIAGDEKARQKHLFLMTHIFYFIEGYNNVFLRNIQTGEEFTALKEEYLLGLNKHFDLVRW